MNRSELEEWVEVIDSCIQQAAYGSKRSCALCMHSGSRPLDVIKGVNPDCENCIVNHYTEDVEGYGYDGDLTPCEYYMRDMVISGEIKPDIHSDPPEDYWDNKFVEPRLKMLKAWVEAKLKER